ncbi:MAG: OmpA family protein, partial [Melioribacteraceae bacterium]
NVGVSYNLWGEIDSDGDGIFDDKDKCPNLEEDYDGFQDEDGCPDLDNDGDGINDDVDLCVNKAEDFDGFEDEDGCPEFDNDRDNIQDSEDKCPNQAEDFDGFEDEDGCPDLDNDGDGILDRVDKCPNQPENINGFEDEDGCPDILPADESEDNLNKKLDANKKYILHGETTFEKNSFILKESKSTELNDIANVMNDNPEVLWRIEGHVEKNDSHSKSTKISIKYADTIKRYLISKGVSSGKLRVIGLGDSSPIATNNTVFGRMKNRRVIIIKLN